MKSFTKSYVIKASPDAVFAALTDQKIVAEWSGGPVTMSANKGAKFSLWGGSIHGQNLEVDPTRIVQAWQEESWEAESTVTFDIAASLKGTEVTLTHEGIPDKSFASIKKGWDKYYMLPLTRHVEATTSSSPFFQPFMTQKGVTRAKMFGWDCLKVNGNVFMTQTPDRLVVKLASKDIERALKLAGSDYFEPTPGMPKMKEWIALPLDPSAEVLSLAAASYDYVAGLPPKVAKAK